MTNKPKSSLSFTKPFISGISTVVGSKLVKLEEEADTLSLNSSDVLRLKKSVGLSQRYIVSNINQTTVDLATEAAQALFLQMDIAPDSIDGIIFVTQSPDYSAPASAIKLQNILGVTNGAFAFDIRLGCSGFIYGLYQAFSLIQAGLNRVLLCVGDVASRIVDQKDHAIAPLMGDAASAIIIESGSSISHFQLYSDGSGEEALIIPNSGLRVNSSFNINIKTMIMNGGEVFNFTLKRVPSMVEQILSYASKNVDQIDNFVLHQPNAYILRTLRKRMGIPEDKLLSDTQSIYGNQNSASIPGTINGFLHESFSTKIQMNLFAGFGIGLSWGAAIVQTDKIYCRETILSSGFCAG